MTQMVCLRSMVTTVLLAFTVLPDDNPPMLVLLDFGHSIASDIIALNEQLRVRLGLRNERLSLEGLNLYQAVCILLSICCSGGNARPRRETLQPYDKCDILNNPSIN